MRDHMPTSTTPGALAVRIIGAVLVAATAAIHLYLYDHGYSSVPTIGRLFLVNVAAGALLGLLIALRGGRLWPLIGAAFCAGTLGAFLWSAESGLFGFHETLHGTWQDRAAIVEVAGVIICVAAAALARRGERTAPALRTTSA
jgi:hypothetical protein